MADLKWAAGCLLVALIFMWCVLTLIKGPEFVCTGERTMECHWVRE